MTTLAATRTRLDDGIRAPGGMTGRSRPLASYLATLVLAILLPITVVLVVGQQLYVRAERQRLNEDARHALHVLALAVDEDLASVLAVLHGLATSTSLARGDLDAFRRDSARVFAGHGGQLALLDPTGRDALADRVAWAPLPPSLWAAIRDDLARKGQAISGVMHSPDGRGWRIAVAVPASASGVSRVLVLLLDPARFITPLREADPPAPLSAGIADADGHIIVRSQDGARLAGFEMPNAREMAGPGGQVDRYNLEGAPVRTTFTRLPLSNWIVLTQFTLDQLDVPLRRSLWFLLAAGLALLTTAAPVAWLVASRTSNAMGAVAKAAERIGRDELGQLPPTAVAEVDAALEALSKSSNGLRAESQVLRSTNQALQTEVAQRTSELVASRSISQVILESSPDCMELLDSSGRILFANSAFWASYDGVRDGLTGVFWADLWPAEGQQAAQEAIIQAQRGVSTRFEAPWRGAGGREQWFDVLVTPIRAGKAGASVLAIARDVTAHHRYEEELRRSKREAEQATQAKTEFVADVSHELRAPLAAILAFADLLVTDDALTPEQRTQVLRIEGAAMALSALAQDLLDVAKIENGEVALECRPFDLAQVIDEAIGLIAPSAEAKGLALAAAPPATPLPPLQGDPDRLRQILLNLLGNAVKFTPSGSVTVALQDEPAADGRHSLLLSVRDTGIGMSREQLSMLCQRFMQNDVFSEPSARGAGLGLAITKRLVTRMGGTLSVESQPAAGSTFKVALTLPAAELLAQPAASSVPSLQGARVLLAEDVPFQQEAARALLEQLGCQVDVVSDGRAAVAAAKGKHYDLVLMDQQLEGVSGTQAARAIRALPSPMNAVPIVSCSARRLDLNSPDVETAGLNGRMDKPTSLAGLARALQPFLGGSDSRIRVKLRGRRTEPAPQEGAKPWLSPALASAAIEDLKPELRAWAEVELARDKAPDLAKRAHRLLSTACVLGFAPLARCCEEFEEAVRAARGMEEALTCLKAEARRILDSLTQAEPGTVEQLHHG